MKIEIEIDEDKIVDVSSFINSLKSLKGAKVAIYINSTPSAASIIHNFGTTLK